MNPGPEQKPAAAQHRHAPESVSSPFILFFSLTAGPIRQPSLLLPPNGILAGNASEDTDDQSTLNSP
jgi:hypothetical protein